MKEHFQPEKKLPQASNNSTKTTGTNHDHDNDASSVASNQSSRSNNSAGSNNTHSGAVKNTNSTSPTNMERKFAETLRGTEGIITMHGRQPI